MTGEHERIATLECGCSVLALKGQTGTWHAYVYADADDEGNYCESEHALLREYAKEWQRRRNRGVAARL